MPVEVKTTAAIARATSSGRRDTGRLPLNVFFLNTIAAEVWGGGEEVFFQWATGLAARGHRVTAAGRLKSLFLDRFKGTDIDIVTLPIGGDFDPRVVWRLSDLFRKKEIDLVCVNFNKGLRLAGLAARWVGRPAVVWVQGVKLPKNRWHHRWLTNRLVDRIIVPSQSLRRELEQFPWLDQRKISVIANGIDLRRFADLTEEGQRVRQQLGVAKSELLIGIFGRLIEAKGHKIFLAAFSELIKKNAGLKTVVVGSGLLESELKNLVTARGLSASVILAGFQKKPGAFMAACDLIVHPALYEPFGLVLLEAMALGKPVVASRVGGIPEVITDGETGLLVPPGDVMALVAAIMQYIENPQLCLEFGARGRRWVEEHFQLDDIMGQVEATLVQIARERREKVG